MFANSVVLACSIPGLLPFKYRVVLVFSDIQFNKRKIPKSRGWSVDCQPKAMDTLKKINTNVLLTAANLLKPVASAVQ